MNLNVAIAGNPNCGKTTMFNALAGTNYQVANYAGVTVEKKSAKVVYQGHSLNFVDLPGTYSLSSYSEDEKVARDYIVDERPNLILQIVDASNLERNLYLTVQLLELNVPMIIALNMIDVAEKRGTIIDSAALSKKLGIPVITTVARKEQGKQELLDAIIKFNFTVKQISINDFSYGDDVDNALIKMIAEIKSSNFSSDKLSPKYIALQYIIGDQATMDKGKKYPEVHQKLMKLVGTLNEHLMATTNNKAECAVADYRYGIVGTLAKDCVHRKTESIDRVFISDEIDKLLTHKIFGPVSLIAILFLAYQFTFWASEYPVGWLESLFGYFSMLAETYLSDGNLKSMVISGIIDGVGGVLGFTPLILFMFFMISILEDTGYMARVAYMLDRLFRVFGLQGNSVIPYVVSGGIAGGCAVPGIMATRTIKGKKERLITILTTPFMVCGAKLPVFSLLIAAFFPGKEAILLLLITMMGWLAALLLAKTLGSTIVKGESSSFLMELPPYRLPTLKGLLLHSWEKTWMYVRKAGTIILAISILLWVLMTFPKLPTSELAKFQQEKQIVQEQFSMKVSPDLLQEKLQAIDNSSSQAQLKYSIAGKIGTAMELFTQYAGFDWRTNIALLSGIAAKELVVSSLGTAYSLGELNAGESLSLSKRLISDPHWNLGVALALMIFTLLYSPCFVALVVIVKETGSIKWGAFALFGYTTMAFIFATFTYNGYQAFITGGISALGFYIFKLLLAILALYFLTIYLPRRGGSNI